MTTPRLRDDVSVREVDGEAVVLDRHQNSMHSFNATAACILKAIDGERSSREISRLVCEVFEVAPDTALADTQKVLAQLEELGLLAEPADTP
jgi:hypothetical protein